MTEGKLVIRLVNTVATLQENQHFGELALIKGRGKRSASIVTCERSEFLTLSEENYNLILTKLKKEDISQKAQILHRFEIFQTSTWTREMLEEMAYVMTERKFNLGDYLYQQREKAKEMYFITRGTSSRREIR